MSGLKRVHLIYPAVWKENYLYNPIIGKGKNESRKSRQTKKLRLLFAPSQIYIFMENEAVLI